MMMAYNFGKSQHEATRFRARLSTRTTEERKEWEGREQAVRYQRAATSSGSPKPRAAPCTGCAECARCVRPAVRPARQRAVQRAVQPAVQPAVMPALLPARLRDELRCLRFRSAGPSFFLEGFVNLTMLDMQGWKRVSAAQFGRSTQFCSPRVPFFASKQYQNEHPLFCGRLTFRDFRSQS